ncbi:unnamed protein product [Bursaphelenchus xylophilus]|uniref:(pine wood nematode) hypothetical protein n=1 Tax=Bursaphelenchus xylophilus TaxID=6326 RepID=A0A1I7SX41_BURXY|nr:unnamed protein product [Bursaphelenchus xylophilus]CAG9100158.1 unnamed protein product [Bursaphelenchus xylophilus]
MLQEKITNKCEFETPCSTDGDCGYKGTCIGGKITKRCVCSCSNFRKCEHDSRCGLNGACDLRHSYCNCTKAYHDHGLGSMENVRRNFCGKKPCLNDDDCFGSMCLHAGFCVCSKG